MLLEVVVRVWSYDRLFFSSCVSIPADVECELLSAGFDPVLSLHVCHELCAVAVDSQDGIARTEVTLGRLAAWCYLKITFTHARTHSTTRKKKRKKEKSCYRWCQWANRQKEKKKSISVGVTTRRPNSTKAVLFWFMQYCLGQHFGFTFTKASNNDTGKWEAAQSFGGVEIFGKDWNIFICLGFWISVKKKHAILWSLSSCIRLNPLRMTSSQKLLWPEFAYEL